MSMSLTGSSGRRPSGGNQKVAGYDVASLNKMSPEQQDLFSQLMGGSMSGIESGLQNLTGLARGDQSQFEQLEAPAMRQFGALQGNIASRFSGMGSGARRSSGFGLAQNSAAQEFAEKLQSQRMSYQQQAIKELLGLGKDLLGRDTQDNFLMEPEVPGWRKLVGGALPFVGAGVGAFGGPAGMALGATLGSQLGGAFSGRGSGQADYSGIGNLSSSWGG